jgi:hypothetical protein
MYQITNAFQSPVYLPIVALTKLETEQARERLKQIRILTKAANAT